jgi:hypothetical protein
VNVCQVYSIWNEEKVIVVLNPMIKSSSLSRPLKIPERIPEGIKQDFSESFSINY